MVIKNDHNLQGLKINSTKKGFDQIASSLNIIYKPDCEHIKQIILKGVVPDLIKHNKNVKKSKYNN